MKSRPIYKNFITFEKISPMEDQLEKIREQQRATWNKFSSGWEKWNDFTMQFLSPQGRAMIDMLGIRETDQVLDIASGTGEPALTIAEIIKKGRVTATDLSEDMLAITSKKAHARGLTNLETLMADCCELPFANGSFDILSCRLGFMFFPDMQMAAAEMFRVLKPGGKMATSVWGIADKNPWIAKIMAVLSKNIEMPPPQPGAPGMFRCSRAGQMEEMLTLAGFKNIRLREIRGSVDYETPERYWQNMSEVAAPVVYAMAKADESTRAKIHSDVLDIFIGDGGMAKMDFAANVFVCEKT